MFRGLFLSGVFASLTWPLLAQNSSMDSLTLQTIEVKATRTLSHAPFASTTLNKKEIEAQNLGQDLPYLLQQLPATTVSSDAGAGIGYTGLRIRGTDGTRINVTLNGIPVNDAESQGTFFVNFGDLASSLNSIQIQRGVGTSTNGSGSFGATMSLSNLYQSDKASATFNMSVGSFNTQKLTLKAGTGLIKNRFKLDLRLSKIHSDGFIDRSSSDLKSFQAIGSWKLNKKSQLKALVMSGKEKTDQAWNGIPEEKLKGNAQDLMSHYQNNLGVLYFTPQDSANLFTSDARRYNSFLYQNQTDNYQQDYYQLHFNSTYNTAWSSHVAAFATKGKGYYEEFKNQQNFNKYGLSPFVTPSNDTFFKTDLVRQLWLDNWLYGALIDVFKHSEKTDFSFGVNAHRYDGKHYGFIKWADYGAPVDYRWYALTSQKTESSVYAKMDRALLKNLNLFVDMQYRFVDYQIDGFRDNPSVFSHSTFHFFNPKIGATYHWKKNNRAQKIYASLAVANKEPNRNDFEAGLSQTPQPERLYDVEAGYHLQHRTWQMLANFYYMSYKNQLILTGKVNDVGAYTRTNVDKSYRAGIELTGTARLTTWLKADANLNFSTNKIINFDEYMDDYDHGGQVKNSYAKTDIAFSPNHIFGANLRIAPWKKINTELVLMGKHVGQQYMDNTANLSRKLDAYSTVDMRLNYSFLQKKYGEIGLAFQLNNILNQKYESNGYTYSYIYGGETITSNFYYPQAGTNFLLNFFVKF